MVKKISFILICILLLFGCSKSEILNSDKIIVDLPELDLENQQLYYYVMGNFGSGSKTDSCAVFLKSSNENSSELTLVVKNKKDVFQLSLGEAEKNPLNHGELFVYDFDKDEVDEIVLFAETSGNGYSIAQVFKVTEEELVLIEDLNKRKDVMTGFEEGKSLLLYNNEISYKNSIDISTEFSDEFFDNQGMYIGSLSVYDLPIVSLEVGGSESRLIYNRPLMLNNYIGTIECGLVWSQEAGGFVIDYLDLTNQVKTGG